LHRRAGRTDDPPADPGPRHPDRPAKATLMAAVIEAAYERSMELNYN
jgi:hypothetical protein